MASEQQQITVGATAPIVSAPLETRAAQATLSTVPAQAQLMSPFSTENAFGAAQRMAKALAASSLVPEAYRGDISNCLIAMELASRIGVSVLAAMQNLDVIHGTPSWRAKFLIATVNASGRFTPLRPQWAGEAGKSTWACRIVAKDKSTGEVCEGPWVTWEMANKEGWVSKKGSKWQTMPELMFFYRAASFWTRVFCPEVAIGFQTTEEIVDTYGETVQQQGSNAALPSQLTPAGAKSLEAVLGLQKQADQNESDADETVDPPKSVTAEQSAIDKAAQAVNATAATDTRQTTITGADQKKR